MFNGCHFSELVFLYVGITSTVVKYTNGRAERKYIILYLEYRKIPKYLDTRKIAVIILKF